VPPWAFYSVLPLELPSGTLHWGLLPGCRLVLQSAWHWNAGALEKIIRHQGGRMGGMVDYRTHLIVFAITALLLFNTHRGPKLSSRFGLRTLLIATTLVAMVLGLIVSLL
jgi:hypothetical protein